MPHSGDGETSYDDLTIMQKMELVRTSRNSLKTSLTNKGKTPTTNIRTYSALVDTLTNTSDANAVAENIDSGKTAYVNGVKITGSSTKVDLTEATSDADAVASNIDTGKTAYVNGVKITGTSTKVDTSDADALASDLVIVRYDDGRGGGYYESKTAYVNGVKISGTMKEARNRDGESCLPESVILATKTDTSGSSTADNKVSFPTTVEGTDSYAVNSTSYVYASISYTALAQLIGLTADKIKAGTTILGITGTYETDLSELEAIADDILGETTEQQGGPHSG